MSNAPQNWLEFIQQNPHDWKAVLEKIFPGGVPRQARWEDPDSIQAILTQLCAKEGVHYTTLPSGGGLDLKSVNPHGTSGLSELLFSSPWVAKIASLSFENITQEELYPWAFFRINVAQLPAEVWAEVAGGGYYQRLTETSPGEYAPESFSSLVDEDDTTGPPVGCRITLLLKGSLIISGKRTTYSLLPGIDLAPQEKCDENEFSKRVERMCELVNEHPSSRSYQNVKSVFLLD